MKQRGFAIGIFNTSSDRKEEPGTKRIGANGKSYRYCKNGATELAAGVFVVSIALHANQKEILMTAAAEVGTKSLTLPITAGGTVLAENDLLGGEFLINTGTGSGHSYEIESSTAVTAASDSISITLKRGIVVALDTTSEFILVRNPFVGAIVSTTLTLPLLGITPVVVPANHYFWVQRTGLAAGYEDDTGMTTGEPFQQSNADAGRLEVAAAHTIRKLGTCILSTADNEWAPVWLELE